MNEIQPLGEESHRYVVDKDPIAIGGMGVVWSALDQNLKRKVAVKSIRSGIVDHLGAYERLSRETRILSDLSHPGICPIYDRYLLNDIPCYTMQLVEGETLKSAIDSLHRSYCPNRSRQLIGDLVNISNTIAYTHEQGILHRDLKPDNILLGSYGEVYVMDWGIASLPNESGVERLNSGAAIDPTLSLSGEILGTPAYASPEQMRGEIENLDEKTDVYGLGAILFEILTGKPPGLISSKQGDYDPPISVSTLSDQKVPDDLAACCRKALSHDPQDRYPHALAFRDELDRYLSGHLIEAAEYSFGETVYKWVQRNRTAVVSGGVIGFLALVVIVIGLINYVQDLNTARRDSDSALARSLQAQGTFLLKDNQPLEAQGLFEQALAIEEELGSPTLPAQLYLAQSLKKSQQPVLSFSYAEVDADKEGWGDAFDYDSESNLLYCAVGNELLVFDADNGLVQKRFTLSPIGGRPAAETSAIVSRKMTLAPDKALIAIQMNYRQKTVIEIRNVKTGDLKRSIETSPRVMFVRFRPSEGDDRGLQLSALSTDGVETWSLADPAKAPENFKLTMPKSGAYTFDYSEEGDQFLIGAGEGSSAVTLYDADSGEVDWVFSEYVSGHAEFMNDGAGIVARVNNDLVLLDRDTGEELDRLSEPEEPLEICKVPGGDGFVLMRSGGTLSIHSSDDLSTYISLFQDAVVGRARDVFAGIGRVLLIDRTNKKWLVWGDEAWLSEEMDFSGKATALAQHPSESIIAVGGDNDRLYLFDELTQKRLSSVDIQARFLNPISFHPDGKELLVGVWRNGFHRLDALTLNEISTFSRKGSSSIYDYSSDGSQILSAINTSLLMIETESLSERLITELPKWPWFVGLPPGNEIVVTAHHREPGNVCPVRILDLRSGALLREFDLGNPNYAVSFSPDGKSCFVGQHGGNMVKVDLDKGVERRALVHESPILNQVISSDGKWLLTQTYGGASHLIDTESLTMAWKFEGSEDTAITRGDYGDSVFLAVRGRQLYALDPHYPERYRRLKAGAFEAMDLIQTDPDNAEALAAIGEWCLFRKSYSLARTYLLAANEALEKSGDASRNSSVESLSLSIAQACWCSGQPEEALLYYRAALAEGAISPYYAELIQTAIKREIAESR